MRPGVRIGVVVGGVAALVAIPSAAAAQFTARPQALATVATATMNPPSNAQISPTCMPPHVTVTWTPTTDPFATGYQLLELADGIPGVAATIVGRTTTTTTYSIRKKSTYRFAMVSTFSTWTSTPTAYSAAITC